MSQNICDYGCGLMAQYQSNPSKRYPKGRNCCSIHFLKCPGVSNKRVNRMNQLTEAGITKYQQMFRDIAAARSPEERSKTAFEREKNLKEQYDNVSGLSLTQLRALKSAKTKNKTVTEDGLNTNQRAGLRSYLTLTNTMDPVTGLSFAKIKSDNHSRMLNTVQASGLTKAEEIGAKVLETRLKIGIDGLNSFERSWIKQMKMLEYLDSGVFYQSSCELSFLRDMHQYYGFDWLVKNIQRGPLIQYPHPDGKERTFMSDFIVSGTIYEIKSLYTYNGNGRRLEWQAINDSKLDAARTMGYPAYLLFY